MVIRYLSENIARHIVRNDDTADLDVLTYGYELILQEVVVILAAMLLALPLGISLQVLVTIAAYALMRRYAGGLHAKHRIVCFTTSVLIDFGPAFFFIKTGAVPSLPALGVLYVLDLALLLRYAPGDTDIRPVRNPAVRRGMKRSAVLVLTLFFGAALLLRGRWPAYTGVLAVTATVVCCFTHPWAYRLFGCRRSTEDERT